MKYMDLKDDIRPRLDDIDWQILRLLQTRACLVKEVARVKDAKGQTLQAADREAAMFAKMEVLCRVLELDFDYISELWSLIIWHAKQMECEELGIDTFMNKKAMDPAELRKNLLALTEFAAPGYDTYCRGQDTQALGMYLDRELHALRRILTTGGLADRSLALDLGCATGQMTEHLQPDFHSVRAFDVSPQMIEWAHKRLPWQGNVSFEERDLDVGIPAEDNSVSLAIANFGCASELDATLLPELKRVLRSGGKALLSFYNKAAMINDWFYPWPTTVRSRLNPFNDTLEVWTSESVYTVRAKGETVAELQHQCRCLGLKVEFCDTYPTLQTILPRFFYKKEQFKDFVSMGMEIDSHLARSTLNRGTYIMTVVTKP